MWSYLGRSPGLVLWTSVHGDGFVHVLVHLKDTQEQVLLARHSPTASNLPFARSWCTDPECIRAVDGRRTPGTPRSGGSLGTGTSKSPLTFVFQWQSQDQIPAERKQEEAKGRGRAAAEPFQVFSLQTFAPPPPPLGK